MPCPKCKSDFTLFNWKIKCGECEEKYCNKCVRRKSGILYCEVCIILIKRPPDRVELMELKVKELRDYLNKNNISTYGLVEKKELVDLLCNKHIPEKQRRGVDKLTANFGDHLKPLNGLINHLEAVVTNPSTARQTPTTSPPQRSSPIYTEGIPVRHEFESAAGPSASPFEEQPTTSYQTYTTPNLNTTLNQDNIPDDFSPSTKKYPRLEDFENTEELLRLSAKDLKILLTIYRVDFKGCIEKHELLEKANRLWEDNNQHKDVSEDAPIQELCKLCMDAPLDCVLLECGHITSCIECGKKLTECPICRQYVVRVVRTFKA